MLVLNDLGRVAFIGLGATALMDLWQFGLSRLGQPVSNFSLVGRWVGHMRHGRFVHEAIAKSDPIPGESAYGWLIHYGVGVAFAALLCLAVRPGWLDQPTPAPALLFGVFTVAAPFLLMQPAMGSGIAAARTAAPAKNRLRSLINHTVFGAGLYLSAELARRLAS
ncbi:MAG: DUF2938 domain-containing protein [Hydrogenophaga sp.]|jgi:hypothetical protein|nr:DUF2938 domain-containing protein [Hydrogenophaga sp.]